MGATALSWALTGFALVLLGLVIGRPAAVGIGTPLVIGGIWSWSQRPARPAGVDAEKIEASFAKGLLTVTLPRSAAKQASAKKISIKSS